MTQKQRTAMTGYFMKHDLPRHKRPELLKARSSLDTNHCHFKKDVAKLWLKYLCCICKITNAIYFVILWDDFEMNPEPQTFNPKSAKYTNHHISPYIITILYIECDIYETSDLSNTEVYLKFNLI